MELRAEAPEPGASLWRRGAHPRTAGARTESIRSVFATPGRWATTFGLCPSESSSAERRRLGSITKHGNPRLRRLMELAWRINHFQPRYRAVRRWAAVLEDPKACAAARKKAIVAVARRLAVDLWRIATGRVQAEDLGLVRKVNVGWLESRLLCG